MSKRTELMIAEDRAKVCEFLARGIRNRAEMARLLNKGRSEEFHISAQQVGKDIKTMEEEYLERGFENIEIYRHQAMNELIHLIKTLYDAYERSCHPKITLESQKAIGDADEYDEIMNQPELEQDMLEGMNMFERDGKVKEESRLEGNPAFLNGIKAAFDSLNKIRGVDGTTKVALTDPTGTEEFSGIAEMMKQRMDELSVREAPTDTDKFLLEAPKEEENDEVVDGEIDEEE
jgi:hypothetical protein